MRERHSKPPGVYSALADVYRERFDGGVELRGNFGIAGKKFGLCG
jgi:hypothetical protein